MATVIAAIIAAFVATFGYLLNARAKTLEERRKTYAAALASVSSYNELPHRIRRRADSTPTTRGTLGSIISDTQRDVDYYCWLLDLESPEVGDAFRALARTAQLFGKKNRDAAWHAPAATTDIELTYPENYPVGDELASQ